MEKAKFSSKIHQKYAQFNQESLHNIISFEKNETIRCLNGNQTHLPIPPPLQWRAALHVAQDLSLSSSHNLSQPSIHAHGEQNLNPYHHQSLNAQQSNLLPHHRPVANLDSHPQMKSSRKKIGFPAVASAVHQKKPLRQKSQYVAVDPSAPPWQTSSLAMGTPSRY